MLYILRWFSIGTKKPAKLNLKRILFDLERKKICKRWGSNPRVFPHQILSQTP